MSELFKFATCSLCSGQLHHAPSSTQAPSAWLGSCSHRLCVPCAKISSSPARSCPVCHLSASFKLLSFANATHVVELLSSVVSELVKRVLELEHARTISNPVSAPHEQSLFAFPIVDSQQHFAKSHYPSVEYQDTSHPAQGHVKNDSLFSLFSASQEHQATQSFALRYGSRDFESSLGTFVPHNEDITAPTTRRERIEQLDRHKPPHRDSRNTLPHRSPNSVASTPTKPKAATTPKTNNKTKTHQIKTQSPSQANLPSNGDNSHTSPATKIAQKPLNDAQKAYLDRLRAAFE